MASAGSSATQEREGTLVRSSRTARRRRATVVWVIIGIVVIVGVVVAVTRGGGNSAPSATVIQPLTLNATNFSKVVLDQTTSHRIAQNLSGGPNPLPNPAAGGEPQDPALANLLVANQYQTGLIASYGISGNNLAKTPLTVSMLTFTSRGAAASALAALETWEGSQFSPQVTKISLDQSAQSYSFAASPLSGGIGQVTVVLATQSGPNILRAVSTCSQCTTAQTQQMKSLDQTFVSSFKVNY